MEKMLEKLRESGSSCIVQSAGGETRYFRQRGVADLYSLVCSDPAFLKGATVADKVVGKAAAALMIKGGVASVYTNMISEPAAGLLPNDDCKAFSSVYVKRIVDAVQDDDFAVILHNCGNGGHCTEAMTCTGAKGYHFGNKIDMADALKECPSDTLVMGNLDPVGVFKNEMAAEVYAETYSLLEKCGNYGNFVISSGCDVPPGIPFENIGAFYKAVADFNQR